MNDEKLIECVRKNRLLYDPSDPNYMDDNLKITAWNKVGGELRKSVSSCKARWRNIRSDYQRSLKNNENVNGGKAKKMKKYKYSHKLGFLNELFEENKAKTDIINKDDEITIQDLKEDDVKEPVLYEYEEDSDNYTTSVDNIRTVSQIHTSQRPIPEKISKQLVLSSSPIKTAAATIKEYLPKKNESTSGSQLLLQDPVDAFLSGIAPTLKSLPLRYWHYAKIDIFAAAQKYELKQLMDQEQLLKDSL